MRPYDSLNISYLVGDHQENVRANLGKIKEVMGARHLMFMNQCHGSNMVVLRKGVFEKHMGIPFADALLTDIPFLALLVQQADCQGVIIFDPTKKVLANVHCGWRGNVQNLLGRVVMGMEKHFGCRPSDLMAAIGPSLGPCCAEFMDYADLFPKAFMGFMVKENFFDLWAVSCWQLIEAGVPQGHIAVSGICTRCRTDLFYSFRAEKRTGRFGTVAMLNR